MSVPADSLPDARTDIGSSGPESIFRLDGRVAVVTGASGGLGARFAHVLAAAGAAVVVAARRLERLEALAATSARLVPMLCDVTDPADLQRLVTETVARFGGIDVVLNNAGITDPVVHPLDLPLEDFRRVVEVNLVAPFHLARLAGRHMTEAGRGSIINVASILGLVAGAPLFTSGYSASKGGITSLTRDLAVQFAGTGIRVNALAPGWFRSEMTSDLIDDERGARHLLRNTPMNRLGNPDELDGAVLFLASDASTFYTGQTLVVDGGWTAR